MFDSGTKVAFKKRKQNNKEATILFSSLSHCENKYLLMSKYLFIRKLPIQLTTSTSEKFLHVLMTVLY